MITLSPWWKQFLTGVLATAIGVGLTFEVNNRVAHHKRLQAQRQTAMMVIYDINDIVRHFIHDKEREDAFYRVTDYLYAHPERLDSVSMDSLWMAGEYIFSHQGTAAVEWADNSTEMVFSGSMEAMQNLGDIVFCDNVQKCYLRRREMLQTIENSFSFRKPLNEDFIYDYRKRVDPADIDNRGMMRQKAMAGLLREAFGRPETRLYLSKYPVRDRNYQDFIDRLVSLNRENQFLMNVTDDDLRRYIERHISATVPAKRKQLVGEWEIRRNGECTVYSLRKDGTAAVRKESRNSVYGQIAYTADGRWTLDGDSLSMAFDPQTLRLTETDNRDTLALISALREREWQRTQRVTLGKSRTVMFWENCYTTPWGQIETNKTQLLKITH